MDATTRPINELDFDSHLDLRADEREPRRSRDHRVPINGPVHLVISAQSLRRPILCSARHIAAGPIPGQPPFSSDSCGSLAGAYERQVLEELLFFLGGQIVDREGSQPSAAPALTTPGRQ